ncbi:hypothetical protein VSP9026_02356 [Vibrio spartinae]|uniref:Uncharacterized protein n=1 Tax=Vibrio spartinae TaxID=1918945 RepID=A0A1N6M5A8_9VIBR|nr:hypothetical protein VSP9026_02356 [Vibrio spartinae]
MAGWHLMPLFMVMRVSSFLFGRMAPNSSKERTGRDNADLSRVPPVIRFSSYSRLISSYTVLDSHSFSSASTGGWKNET